MSCFILLFFFIVNSYQTEYNYSHIHISKKYSMSRYHRIFLSRGHKGQKRTIPSPSAAFRYLPEFHDGEQEKLGDPSNAFIPLQNSHIERFLRRFQV